MSLHRRSELPGIQYCASNRRNVEYTYTASATARVPNGPTCTLSPRRASPWRLPTVCPRLVHKLL
jgi:hypothetical protein